MATKAVKIRMDGPFVMAEFERIGQLVRQGYSKAPGGRPCLLCGHVGGVWIKDVRGDTAEACYCSECNEMHTVEVK